MRRLAFVSVGVVLAFMSFGAVAQDDIEGDLPPGKPFDGTSDRASMFDLFQVARIAVGALEGRGEADEAAFALVLDEALAAKGYPGTRITVFPESAALNLACAEDNRIETRVGFDAETGAVAVVVASQVWVSEARLGQVYAGNDEVFATDCAPN